ncbi:Protein POF1B, partial [Ophiophagus hannah]
LQEVPSPSLKLSPYSQGSVRRIILENPEKEPLSPLLRGGNNVIYEKTIRKYELLNPDEEKQYQYLQQTQTDQCQVSQPVERIQVVQQCQQTTNACDSTPVKCTQETNDQLDCRYFGELLAELHRKSNDLHSCLLQHVEKLGGRRCDLESLNEREDIESLIPKGLSESTKQQIRYLLEMRATADKSMKLVLATFSNLREELVHLQDDLGKLEMDKMLLEKDLAFKEAQVKEYEMLLASVRENNRQQQQALREYTLKCRSLEEQLLSLRHNDGEREFRLKDLEYSKRALEQEIQNLRLQASTNPLGQTTTDELSSRYVEMINQLREDKDLEIRSLRIEARKINHQPISRNDKDHHHKKMTTKLRHLPLGKPRRSNHLLLIKNLLASFKNEQICWTKLWLIRRFCIKMNIVALLFCLPICLHRKLDDYLILSLKLKTGFEIGKLCLYECRDGYDDGFTPSQA